MESNPNREHREQHREQHREAATLLCITEYGRLPLLFTRRSNTKHIAAQPCLTRSIVQGRTHEDKARLVVTSQYVQSVGAELQEGPSIEAFARNEKAHFRGSHLWPSTRSPRRTHFLVLRVPWASGVAPLSAEPSLLHHWSWQCNSSSGPGSQCVCSSPLLDRFHSSGTSAEGTSHVQ